MTNLVIVAGDTLVTTFGAGSEEVTGAGSDGVTDACGSVAGLGACGWQADNSEAKSRQAMMNRANKYLIPSFFRGSISDLF